LTDDSRAATACKETENMKRREFLGTNLAAMAGGALAAGRADAADAPDAARVDTPSPATTSPDTTSRLSPDVQMQFMRPGQLEAAGRKFPVVYVPFGPIEWHGVHLPLGTDAIKAHGILVKCAEKFGGVVCPPVYFHNGFPLEHLVPLLTGLFQRLKRTGYRVIVGVSGHNVKGQIDMIEEALKPVTADGQAAGIGLWEITLSRGPESGTDHAAKWETSDMMFFYPDQVDMGELGDGPLNLDMKPPTGIGGLDPRKHASAAVGRRNVELAADAIGRKAQELLASLPKDRRSFNSKGVRPGNWWMI